jgi:hypothetical protein
MYIGANVLNEKVKVGLGNVRSEQVPWGRLCTPESEIQTAVEVTEAKSCSKNCE